MHVVELTVDEGRASSLKDVYLDAFRSAVSRQPGFRSVLLLEPRSGTRWLLLIDFETDAARLAWVATRLHADVWGRLSACCREFLAENLDAVG